MQTAEKIILKKIPSEISERLVIPDEINQVLDFFQQERSCEVYMYGGFFHDRYLEHFNFSNSPIIQSPDYDIAIIGAKKNLRGHFQLLQFFGALVFIMISIQDNRYASSIIKKKECCKR